MKTLVQYFSKSLSNDFCKRSQELLCRSRYIYRTQVSPRLKQCRRLKKLLEWTIAFMSTLILAQMILTVFWTLFGSSLPVVAVGTFCLITLLWLLVALEELTSGKPWIIFRPASK